MRGGCRAMGFDQPCLCNFVIIQVLPFLNNPKNLDPSYKMDLDFWDCFGRDKKTLSYNQRNTVHVLAFMIILKRKHHSVAKPAIEAIHGLYSLVQCCN